MIFVNNSLRYKLFWLKPYKNSELPFDYPVMDIGKSVAQFISQRKINKHIGLDVEDYLRSVIRNCAQEVDGNKGIALRNIGILLESELSLNVEKILMDLSQQIIIILCWPFEIESSRRFLWESGAKVALEFPEQSIHRLEV